MTQENEPQISAADMATVAGYSALAGLCPLIPIPFVDDVIINRVHRRMLQKLVAPYSFYLSADDAKYLADKPSSLLSGALKSLLLWPIKKLIRKVVYVLAIKSCADVATAIFHEGWLFARALSAGYVDPAALGRGDKEVLEKLRGAIHKTVEEVDPDATQQVMRSAFGVGREVIDSMGATAREFLGQRDEDVDDQLDKAEESLSPLSQRIQDELKDHWSLGSSLDETLRRELGVQAKQENT